MLADWEIEKLCELRAGGTRRPMIEPFTHKEQRHGISHGLSYCGYDITLGNEFIRYTPDTGLLVPGANILQGDYEKFTVVDGPVVLMPGDFLLGTTFEYFKMPKNIAGLVKDKSTYVRCGICVQNTVLEPGWEGNLTLEITNHNNRPVAIMPFTGIAQIIFHEVNCNTSYDGKYQKQSGVTLPKGARKQDQ